MDKERIAAALAMVEKYRTEHSNKKGEPLSYVQAGKDIGVSDSILSSLRSGTYKGDTEKQIKIIEDYFSIKTQYKDAYQEINYVGTSISSTVYDIIKLCHIKGGLSMFAGDAGIGKTKAAEKYVRDNPNNSIYITLNPCFTSVKSLLKLLAKQVGAKPSGGTDDMWTAIRSRLSDGMIIIFDEAQHLTYKSIETIRAFSDDFAKSGQTLGVCFIGNIDTVRKLSAFAQLDNRTKHKPIYTTKKIKRTDIEMLFPILKINNMDAEIDFLWKIAQTHQAIRGVVNLFSNAYDHNDYTLNGLVKIAKENNLDLTGIDIRSIKRKDGAA